MARSGCLALGFLLLSGSSCLLYTDEINHPPEVVLTGDTETFWKATVRPHYHAEARDQDQGAQSLTYEWRRQPDACPGNLATLPEGAVVAPSGSEFDNDLDLDNEFCVWVTVRDKHGATARAAVTTKVKHKPTVAVIDIVKPTSATPMGAAMAVKDGLPLMSEVQLSGAKSNDPESEGDLQFDWTLTRGGADAPAHDCPGASSSSDLCFTGDKDGTYEATLTVRDQRGGVATAKQSVVIAPDAPPCIVVTDPMYGMLPTDPARIVRDPSDPVSTYFEVKAVTDDVDPYPRLDIRPSTYTFKYTWWKDGDDPTNPPGRRTDDTGQTARMQFLADDFRNGDTVYVRLKVEDRVHRDFSSCDPGKIFNCALDQRRDCFQWVTWKVDFKPLKEMVP